LPRKSTRHADEHRITLGDFERSELRKVVRFQQFGPLLQGAGFATLGLAGLLGAVVFMRYKHPTLFKRQRTPFKPLLPNPCLRLTVWRIHSPKENGVQLSTVERLKHLLDGVTNWLKTLTTVAPIQAKDMMNKNVHFFICKRKEIILQNFKRSTI